MKKEHNLQSLIVLVQKIIQNIQRSKLNIGLKSKTEKVLTLKKQIEDPDIWKDIEKLQEIQKNITNFKKEISIWNLLEKDTVDLLEYIEIALLENAYDMYISFEKTYEKINIRFKNASIRTYFSNDDDKLSAYINIHPGAGGTESHDWVAILYRMYTRWLEKNMFSWEIIYLQEGEEAGYKNITLLVKGEYVYGYLKSEHGVHRLVRISPFDSNDRRHTSFASVQITPDIPQDINIDLSVTKLRIDTFRASGAGGQHVNKTDSAIRITHLSTGITVSCQNQRSQTQNKETAFKMLKSKLYVLEKEKKKEELTQRTGEKKDISWGNQIRSYVFQPYTLIKDTRTGEETGNINSVLDGNIDLFINAYLKDLYKKHEM